MENRNEVAPATPPAKRTKAPPNESVRIAQIDVIVQAHPEIRTWARDSLPGMPEPVAMAESGVAVAEMKLRVAKTYATLSLDGKARLARILASYSDSK